MAAPESSGYVPLEGFKYGMKKLGLLVKNVKTKGWEAV
jgi:hypothetical protein